MKKKNTTLNVIIENQIKDDQEKKINEKKGLELYSKLSFNLNVIDKISKYENWDDFYSTIEKDLKDLAILYPGLKKSFDNDIYNSIIKNKPEWIKEKNAGLQIKLLKNNGDKIEKNLWYFLDSDKTLNIYDLMDLDIEHQFFYKDLIETDVFSYEKSSKIISILNKFLLENLDVEFLLRFNYLWNSSKSYMLIEHYASKVDELKDSRIELYEFILKTISESDILETTKESLLKKLARHEKNTPKLISYNQLIRHYFKKLFELKKNPSLLDLSVVGHNKTSWSYKLANKIFIYALLDENVSKTKRNDISEFEKILLINNQEHLTKKLDKVTRSKNISYDDNVKYNKKDKGSKRKVNED